MDHPRILIVVTSHAQLGTTGRRTGLWLEELAIPHRLFSAAGASVAIASPTGGPPPIDPASAEKPGPEVRAFRDDPDTARRLDETLALDRCRPADHDAIFVAGGHGVMWDLAASPPLAALLSDSHRRGAVIGAVCHGPAALVGATGPNGQPLVSGLRVTGFSNEEERAAELDAVVPFLLEDRLRLLGARFERGAAWASHVVTDGHLVTGQNPASSRAVAEEIVRLLRAAPPR
jgi:putative intracellular protease/amidase